jgi:hypothetical protein
MDTHGFVGCVWIGGAHGWAHMDRGGGAYKWACIGRRARTGGHIRATMCAQVGERDVVRNLGIYGQGGAHQWGRGKREVVRNLE